MSLRPAIFPISTRRAHRPDGGNTPLGLRHLLPATDAQPMSSPSRKRGYRARDKAVALDSRLRGCQETGVCAGKNFSSSFPRKREPRDFIRLPWAPAFAGATTDELAQLDYTFLRGNDDPISSIPLRRSKWRC